MSERYWLLVCPGMQNWTFKGPVCTDRNAKKNLKKYMKDKGMETFRGSQGKHFGCVLTRSLTLWMTSRERLGGYVKCGIRLRLRVRPLCRLRFPVVPAARLMYVEVPELLQKAALMGWNM